MSPVAITLLVIVIVLAIIIAVLYFLGKKAQKTGRTAGAVRCQQTDRIHADHR